MLLLLQLTEKRDLREFFYWL